MKTQPTFEKTVDVLVKVYLNGTLEAALCQRCAVGNIISGGDTNYNFYKHGVSWYTALGLNGSYGVDYSHPDIINSGYTAQDLIRIEAAFMYRDAPHLYTSDPFPGLMRVVDVLADIHGIDLEKKEAAKLLFVKA